MKKHASILKLTLVFLILMGIVGNSLADNELHRFDARLTESFSFSSTQWIESEENRAVFAVSILLDARVNGECPYTDLCSTDGQLYVGKMKSQGIPTLGVISIHPDYDEILTVLYLKSEENGKKDISWGVASGNKNNNTYLVENLLSAMFNDGFFKLEDKSIISEALSVVEEKLSPEEASEAVEPVVEAVEPINVELKDESASENIINSSDGSSFTLHSGVNFSMNKNEVFQKEKDAGFDVKFENADSSYRKNCSTIHDSEQLTVSGQIAGVKGAFINYHFSKADGTLDAATYYLQVSSTQENKYETIRKSLIDKYGLPQKDGLAQIFHEKLPMDCYSFIDDTVAQNNVEALNWSCNADYINDDVWIIPQGDGTSVIISGVNSVIKMNYSGTKYTYYLVNIGYQKFNSDTINDILTSIENEFNIYQNQLQNDL